jgi:hypothetical protein
MTFRGNRCESGGAYEDGSEGAISDLVDNLRTDAEP